MNELVIQIANILAPGILLALTGLVWYRKGPAYPVDFVTTLILNVAAPAFLFHTLATSVVPLASLGFMALCTIVVHAVVIPVAMIILRLAGKPPHLSMAFAVGNTGNLGLPVCYFAFGNEGLAYAMAFFSVQCLMLFSIGDVMYSGVLNILKMLKSPILHAIWLGVVVNVLELQLPQAILSTTELLGQIVIPIMLITLGVSLAGMQAAHLPATMFWSLIRTTVAMAAGFSVAILLGMEGTAGGVLILQSVAPVAVFNYLLSLKHGRDPLEVSGMILVTHLAALIYLPIVLAIVLRTGIQ